MPHGDFVWYELMTTDAKAAEAFYRDVVGWRPQDSGQTGMAYTLLMIGDAGVAGLMKLDDQACEAGAKPGWIGYIAADDVDATAERVKLAGGKIHYGPADIPNVGRFATVADPQGAVFALFKPTGHMDAPPPRPSEGAPGTIGWHELFAADGAKAFDFYSKTFGWQKADAVDMGPMGIYQLFGKAGQAVGGMMTKPPNIERPVWNYYFNVDGIDAAAARVKAGNGQVVNGPMQVPGGTYVLQAIDPQGAFFCLHSKTK
jgi:predicted enzyme related to lactoylglutathione lyase